jgi:purine-nucleoside phosphorylase
MFVRRHFEESADVIRQRTLHRPRIGLILGSGLGSLADEVAEASTIPFAEVPHFPQATVEGHSGRLVIGRLAGKTVLVMQGRIHYYEGYTMEEVVLPVRVMQALGVKTLIVTNAAGGLNPAFRAGDLMLITDHIGLAALAGHNPLLGPNDPALGPRFVNMTAAYDPALRALALRVAQGMGLTLHQGVYVGLAGPAFETPAEVRFLRAIGGDAVGMSTVPEVIAARHGGMRVLGLSGITNVAQADSSAVLGPDHEEVLQVGRSLGPRLAALVKGILAEMDSE